MEGRLLTSGEEIVHVPRLRLRFRPGAKEYTSAASVLSQNSACGMTWSWPWTPLNGALLQQFRRTQILADSLLKQSFSEALYSCFSCVGVCRVRWLPLQNLFNSQSVLSAYVYSNYVHHGLDLVQQRPRSTDIEYNGCVP